ncbi:MAG TPA: thiamine phosphate synthase [Usitatibacter sp.]|nr:thiamine phosphate synthase [Usitatibacter sp.]
MATGNERARLRGLYAVTPDLEDTELLARRVEACLAGGAALVQYRAKTIAPDLALRQARRLVEICHARGVPLFVNDSVELAAASNADGVHLGREDGDARAARRILPRGIIGVSCYADPSRARAAAEAGADYVAVGSMFASGTKPAAVRAPLDLVARMREDSGLPVAAIGGITPGNAAEVIAAGADMVAVIGGVFDAADVTAASRSIARLFEPATRHARTQPQSL